VFFDKKNIMRPHYDGKDAWPNFERDDYLRGKTVQQNRKKTMNFESYASEGNRFIREVANRLQTDRNTAGRITRAVLHAIRDRLPADDAIQFAQGLPMALKGVFIDQYDLSKVPLRIRHSDNFLDYIYTKNGRASITDFPNRESVVAALQAVFYVLERNMDFGQVQQIKDMLPMEIVDVIEDYY
jgi:uncharacterized protein (DUF2267 family)